MGKKLLFASVILCALVVMFQHCSAGDSGSVGELNQSSQGSAADLPTVTVDNSSLALSSTANFSVTGTCDLKGQSDYTFIVRFQETGVSSPAVTTIDATCTNGRYNLVIIQASLGMRSGYPGVMTIRIALGTGEEGPGANVNISITASTGTGTSTGTTTSTSTGTSTGTTTGETPGCPRTDGSCNLATDPFTAFGGGCCRSAGWWMCNNPAMPACTPTGGGTSSGGSSSGGTSSGGTSSSGTTTGAGVGCPRTDGSCNLATDPFTAFGGGCCRSGGWWMCDNPSMPACTGGGTSSGGTTSSGTTTGAAGVDCPRTDGTCNLATDPFVAFGGGCCRDGGWWMCNNTSMPTCP